MLAFDLNVALARETPDLLNVAFLLIGPVTPRILFDLTEERRQNNSNHFSREISHSPADLQYEGSEKNHEQ